LYRTTEMVLQLNTCREGVLGRGWSASGLRGEADASDADELRPLRTIVGSDPGVVNVGLCFQRRKRQSAGNEAVVLV
jgi:hypothetical protein